MTLYLRFPTFLFPSFRPFVLWGLHPPFLSGEQIVSVSQRHRHMVPSYPGVCRNPRLRSVSSGSLSVHGSSGPVFTQSNRLSWEVVTLDHPFSFLLLDLGVVVLKDNLRSKLWEIIIRTVYLWDLPFIRVVLGKSYFDFYFSETLLDTVPADLCKTGTESNGLREYAGRRDGGWCRGRMYRVSRSMINSIDGPG